MARPRGEDTWLDKEPTAQRTGWRIPRRVRDAVHNVFTGKDISEEQMVTKWLKEKVAERLGRDRK
jgi:hypothetical protein